MKRIDLAQGPIEYAELGHGPPLVFVHGVLVDHQIWSGVTERLAGSFRCIAPRLPIGCHHLPMRPDADLSVGGQARLVQDFLDALDLESVTLVGNDTGGAVCQILAGEDPRRVRRLVLTDCDAFEVFPPRGFGHLLWGARIPGLPRLIFGAMRAFPRLSRLRWAYGALTFRELEPELVAGWIEPASRSREVRRDLLKLLEDAGPAVTLAAAERLHRFSGPVLLVWSRDDRFFPLSLAERLIAKCREGRLEVIEGAGLLVPLDRPDAVAEAVARFCQADRT